jgi:hypothetical protein
MRLGVFDALTEMDVVGDVLRRFEGESAIADMEVFQIVSMVFS